MVGKAYNVRNQAWCYHYCINDEFKRCRSFNFQITTKDNSLNHQCEINYSTKNKHPESLKQRPGWVYEEISDADSQPLLAPVVVKTKEAHLVVEEDSKVILNCTADGHPMPTFSWKKLDQQSKILSNKAQHTFENIRLLDDGTYICTASNILSNDSVSVKVTVVPKPGFEMKPPQEVVVPGGFQIQLDCKGTHSSNITWQRKDERSLPREHQFYSNGTLVLFNVTSSTSGVYVCKVSTSLRSVTSNAEVKVHYRSCSHVKADGLTSKYQHLMKCEQCPPFTYNLTLEDHQVETYKVHSPELCHNYCINDKFKRRRSFNYQIATENKIHLCEINYSTENRHPESMKQKSGWVYEEIAQANKLPILVPVMVKTEKSFFMVEEHSKVSISCTATGEPRPIIRWLKKRSGEYALIASGDQLTFRRVWLQDEGIYICNASNILNIDSALVNVTVVPKLGFEIKPPQRVSAASGSRIQLDCKGTRFSTVTWRREYEGVLRSIEHELYSNGTLVLLNVTNNTYGVYVCNASTKFRSINASTLVYKVVYRSCSHLKAANVNVKSGTYYIDPDGEEGENGFAAYCDMRDKNGVGVTVIRHHTKHVTCWYSKRCVDVSYPGVSITQLSSLTKIASFCEQFVSFSCSSNYFHPGYIWWLSRDGKLMKYWGGATGYSRRCACGMTRTCLFGGPCNCWFRSEFSWNITKWEHFDAGFLNNKVHLPVNRLIFILSRNASWSGWELGEFKCNGIISDTEPVKIYAPKSVRVPLLGSMVLSCKASGRPTPQITWRRKDSRMIDALITVSAGTSNLTFVNVQPDNNGTFICEAQNDVNREIAETDLLVLELIFRAPPFVTYAERAWIQLDCKTSPDTTVTWSRKGRYLPKQHLIFPNGSLVMQNVSSSYSGTYICSLKGDSKIQFQESLVIIGNLSCSHIRAGYPFLTSGNYTIDPDGEGGEQPFEVYCDMNDENSVTVIGHDIGARSSVKGCNALGCYQRNVTYHGATKTQLGNLVNVSTRCEQFIMFECNGSISFISETAASWVSRDGKPRYDWGGATPHSRKCACGMTDSCVGGGVCNCKSRGPAGWRNDSGKLTDIRSLPVSGFQFGDIGNGKGYYSLGKLRCYGKNQAAVPVISWAMLAPLYVARVWINGKEIRLHFEEKWIHPQNYTFEGQWKAIAVEILGNRRYWGLLASFSDGSVTSANSGWRCIVDPSILPTWSRVDFDDSHWPKAVEFNNHKVDGIDRRAKWIRTFGNGHSYLLIARCRRKF